MLRFRFAPAILNQSRKQWAAAQSPEMVAVSVDICSAMEYCHSLGFVDITNGLHLRFGVETQFAVNSRYKIVIIFLSNTMYYKVLIIVIC